MGGLWVAFIACLSADPVLSKPLLDGPYARLNGLVDIGQPR